MMSIKLAKDKMKFGQVRSNSYDACALARRPMSQWMGCRIGVGKERGGRVAKRSQRRGKGCGWRVGKRLYLTSAF